MGQARREVIGCACGVKASPEGVGADGGRTQRHGADELQASCAARGHDLGRRRYFVQKSQTWYTIASLRQMS